LDIDEGAAKFAAVALKLKEDFAKPCFCPNSSRKFSGGFEITQALTLTKIPGFSKPS